MYSLRIRTLTVTSITSIISVTAVFLDIGVLRLADGVDSDGRRSDLHQLLQTISPAATTTIGSTIGNQGVRKECNKEIAYEDRAACCCSCSCLHLALVLVRFDESINPIATLCAPPPHPTPTPPLRRRATSERDTLF